jgi:hypothetical protein
MKFWLTVCGLIIACLGAAAQWWQRDHTWWRAPAAKRPDVPVVTQLPAEPPPALAEAIARPLLWSVRRPPRARTQEDRLLEELNRSNLLAVVQSGPRRIALLKGPDGDVRRYDDQSHPWRLEAFNGREGTFVGPDGQRVVRPLQAPPPAPRR